jgi:fatty acid desaturase
MTELLVFLVALPLAIHAVPACHEYAHGARWSYVRQALFRLLCCLTLMNPVIYRSYHLAHHRHAGTAEDPEGDHECITISQWFSRVFVTPVVSAFRECILACVGRFPRHLPKRHYAHAQVWAWLIVIFWSVFGLVMIVVAPSSLIALILAIFLGAFVGDALLSMPEHVNLSRDGEGRIPARIVETNAIIAWLTRNQNLHALHHARPDLPWHELPKIKDKLSLPPGTTYINGYIQFHRDLLTKMMNKSY